MVKAEQRPSTIPALAQQLLALLSIGLAASIVSAWVATSYYGIDVVGSLVWPGADGYCDPSTQGAGVHCFSDIALHLSVGSTMVPQDPGLIQYVSNLPPGGRTIFWFFQGLAEFIGWRFALTTYLLISAACLLVPSLWAVRGRSWSQAAPIVLLIGVATMPFLATLDRGNNIAFTVPLLLLFVLGLQRDRLGWAIAALVLLVQVKPQFIILVFALLVVRRYRATVIAVVVSGLTFLASFLIFLIPTAGGDPVGEFKKFVLFSQFRSQYVELSTPYPPNVSLVSQLGHAAHWIGVSLDANVLQVLVVGILGVVLITLVVAGKDLPIVVSFSVVAMISALAVSVTFIYYFTPVLVISALLFRQDFARQVRSIPRLLRWWFLLTVTLSLSPLLVPGARASAPVDSWGSGVVVSVVPNIASTMWLVFFVWVSTWAVIVKVSASRSYGARLATSRGPTQANFPEPESGKRHSD